MAKATTDGTLRACPSDYTYAVEKVMKDKGVSRGEATRMVNRERPVLRAAYARGRK